MSLDEIQKVRVENLGETLQPIMQLTGSVITITLPFSTEYAAAVAYEEALAALKRGDRIAIKPKAPVR